MDRAEAVYTQILAEVGVSADQLPDRDIAAHWPFVGSRYRGLVIVGQALDGWDAEETPARWRATAARTPEGREAILSGVQKWATCRAEPMSEVLRWGHRRRSPFWGLSKRLVPMIEPCVDDGEWPSRYAWWNVYPLGWESPTEGPTGLLKDLQTPFVKELFWAVLERLQARRIVLVAGKDWWWDVRRLLGLGELDPRVTPIIASGRLRGKTIVASYHPGAHLKGVTRDAFAAAIATEIRKVEGD